MFLSDLVSNIQSSVELQNVCVQYLRDTGTVSYCDNTGLGDTRGERRSKLASESEVQLLSVVLSVVLGWRLYE